MTGKKLSANTLPHIIHLVSITWWMRPGLSHFSLLFFYFCILLDSKTGRPGNETVTYMHQYTVISSSEMTGHEIQRFIIWNFEYGKHYSGPEYAVKPLNHCKLIPQSAHSLIPHSASCPSFKPWYLYTPFTLPLPMTQYIYCHDNHRLYNHLYNTTTSVVHNLVAAGIYHKWVGAFTSLPSSHPSFTQ